MPGKHDPAKKYVSFSLKREIWYKLTQEAESRGMDRSSFVIEMFESELRRLGVKLTPENQEKMEQEIADERKRRAATWSGYEERRAKILKTLAAKNQTKPKAKQEKKGKKQS